MSRCQGGAGCVRLHTYRKGASLTRALHSLTGLATEDALGHRHSPFPGLKLSLVPPLRRPFPYPPPSQTFIDGVWHPLRDPKATMRDTAVKALKACLMLVEKRETRYRVQVIRSRSRS